MSAAGSKRGSPRTTEEVYEAMEGVETEADLAEWKIMLKRVEDVNSIFMHGRGLYAVPCTLLCCAAGSTNPLSFDMMEYILEAGASVNLCAHGFAGNVKAVSPVHNIVLGCLYESSQPNDAIVALQHKKMELILKQEQCLAGFNDFFGEGIFHSLCQFVDSENDLHVAKFMKLLAVPQPESYHRQSDDTTQNINKTSSYGSTALSCIMLRRHFESVNATMRTLLQQPGLDLDQIANFSWRGTYQRKYTYALLFAADRGDAEAIQMFFDSGLAINPNVFDSEGRTALRLAAGRSVECVRVLLTHPDIDPDLLIAGGLTALQWAKNTLTEGAFKTEMLEALGYESDSESDGDSDGNSGDDGDEDGDGNDDGEEEEEEEEDVARCFAEQDCDSAWAILSNDNNATQPARLAKIKAELGIDEAEDLGEVTEDMFGQLANELKPVKRARLEKLFR